jgi:hypothetical protein
MGKNWRVNNLICTFAASLALAAITIATAGGHDAQALGQNDSTALTSKTPIDIITVIEEGEESVNNKLDQARQAIQSNNTSQALRDIEQAKEDLYTLAVCATTVINTTTSQQ